jgi:hypothetical protein
MRGHKLAFNLDFYSDALGAPRSRLDHFVAMGVTLDEARNEAASIMKNVKFAGGMSNLCIIKDDKHLVVGEVRPKIKNL